MAVKINKGSAGGIDFTPMIDMVFNLLIFFMVTTEFAKEDYELKLPLASADEARAITADVDAVYINIDEEGRYYVNRRYMQLDDLEAYLKQKQADNPGRLSVRLRPDANGSVQATISALNLCLKAQVSDVSFATAGEAP